MKQMQKLLGLFLAVVLMVVCVGQPGEVSAKKKAVLSKKKVTLEEGKTTTLKVRNNKKKVKWSSSKKAVATVTQKGKVTAKKKGKATITAKIGKTKLKCSVSVKEKIVYKTQSIENFESYEVGTDWANYTLGEGLASGGTEAAHYLKEGETMKVVADPENPSNKVLQIIPKFYSFCPVFTVDLTKLTGVPTKKLGDYAGVRVKIRVVSDASCHAGIGLGAFFGAAGTIDKRYAFNTYTTQENALPAEREFYKFFHDKGMLTGVTGDDGKMPQFDNGKHMKGHKFLEKDANAGFATKTLTFNQYLTEDLKSQTTFDFVLGGSYSTPVNGEYLAWYLDEVELIYR